MEINMDMEHTEYRTITCSIEPGDPSSHTEEIVVSNYEDLASENISSSQNDDDQMGEQVLGYLEVQPSDTDNATIILQPEGIEIDGQRLILTQGEEGNEIIVVVSADQDCSSEQTVAHFAQSSVLQSMIPIETSTRNHSIVVTDDSPGAHLELIETEVSEVPQSHDEIHHQVFIERNGNLSSLGTDGHSSIGNSVEIGSSVWTIKESDIQEKDDSTEMLFIPTSSALPSSANLTSSLLLTSSDENKSPNLMQLACIAQEIHSANQKNNHTSSGPINTECLDSLNNHGNSDVSIEQQTEHLESSSVSLLEPSESLQSSETTSVTGDFITNQAPVINTSESYLQKSDIQSSVTGDDIPTYTSYGKTLDNTVSVIHVTSSSEYSHMSHIGEVEVIGENYVTEDVELKNPSNRIFVSLAENSDASADRQKAIEERTVDENSEVQTHEENKQFCISTTSEQIDGEHTSNVNEHLDVQTSEFNKTNEQNFSVPCKEESHTAVIEQTVTGKNLEAYEKIDCESAEISTGASTMGINESEEDLETMKQEESISNEKLNSEGIEQTLPETPITIKKFSPRVTRSRKSNTTNTFHKRNLHENLNNSNNSQTATENETKVMSQIVHLVKSSETLKSVQNVGGDEHCVIASISTIPTTTKKSSFPRKMSLRNKTLGLTSRKVSSYKKNSSDVPQKVESKTIQDDGLSTQYDSLYEEKFSVKESMNDTSSETRDSNITTCIVDNSPVECENAEFGGDVDVFEFTSEKIDTGKNAEIDLPDKELMQNIETKAHPELETESQINNSETSINEDDLSEDITEPVSIIQSVNSTNSPKDDSDAGKDLKTENELVNDYQAVETEKCDKPHSLENHDKASEVNSILEAVTTEETLVKPPKKTYTRKNKIKSIVFTEENKSTMDLQKIELFSCEELGSDVFDSDSKNQESMLENESSNHEIIQNIVNFDDDDDTCLLSDVKSKVSATYRRKRKSTQNEMTEASPRRLRKRALIARDSFTPSVENHSKSPPDTSLSEKTQSGNTDDVVDLRLENSNMSKHNDNESDLNSMKPPESNSLPTSATTNKEYLLPLKKRRSKVSKSKVKSGNSWEKLIKSSPAKLKNFKQISKRKLKEKVQKQFMSLCNPSYSKPPKRGRPKKQIIEPMPEPSKVMSCEVDEFVYFARKYNFVRERLQKTTITTNLATPYYCANCKFSSTRIENIITHTKMCFYEPDIIDYALDDMDRRQRIRGEDPNDKSMEEEASHSNENLSNGLARALFSDNVEPECSKQSGIYSDFDSEEDIPPFSEVRAKNKFGFSEDDVVWVKVKNTYWPALVCRLYHKERKSSVLPIDSPLQRKGLKVKVKKLLTFNDAEVNKKILDEGRNCPDPENFLKATQKAENYVRKRKILKFNVRPKNFFGIASDDAEEFSSDIESCSSSEPDSKMEGTEDITGHDMDLSNPKDSKDSQERSNSEERKMSDSKYLNDDDIDVSKLLSCLLQGIVNEHLVGIYNDEVKSERHKTFFSSDPAKKRELKSRSWFGPIDSVDEHGRVFDYFHDMFRSCCSYDDPSFIVPYIYEVWIPEAIVKAISLVQDVTIEEAEVLFENGVNVDRPGEISIEEIEKLYE